MTNKFKGAAAMAALVLAPVQAQSVADLLQKRIYAQEMAGDLDGAIQLFRQAINAASPGCIPAAHGVGRSNRPDQTGAGYS
jgi:hypothetical protein